jgi:integrase
MSVAAAFSQKQSLLPFRTAASCDTLGLANTYVRCWIDLIQLGERKSMAPKKKTPAKRQAWNKGLVVGKRDGFTPAQVKRIRGVLADRGDPGLRDLALFATAIDTMLHGQDLLNLVVGDVQSRNGSIRPVVEIARGKGWPPIRCALSKVTANALEKWITASGKRRTDHLFPGSGDEGRHPLSVRQLNRLVKFWVAEAGLDSRDYGIESLRRTKALHILRGTGDLQTVRALLGHVQIESTARYLGLKTKADPIAVSRAFDI